MIDEIKCDWFGTGFMEIVFAVFDFQHLPPSYFYMCDQLLYL